MPTGENPGEPAPAEQAQELLRRSVELERHATRLRRLWERMQGRVDEKVKLTSVWDILESGLVSMDDLSRRPVREEGVREEIVAVHRLLYQVTQRSDDTDLTQEMRRTVQRRIQEAQAIYQSAVVKFPIDPEQVVCAEYLDYVLRQSAAPGWYEREQTSPPGEEFFEVFRVPRVEIETEALRRWREKSWTESEEQYRRRIASNRDREGALTKFAPVLKRRQRLVLLGAPGSGKTALLRFLVNRFAKACVERQSGVLAGGEDYGAARLPLSIRLATYAAAYHQSGHTLDLHTFLCRSFADVPVDQMHLSTLLGRTLERGEALVLLDGLDEILEAPDRREIVQRIEEFAGAYRRNVVLVTSRQEGYEEAPLRGLFTHSIGTLEEPKRKQIAIFLEKGYPVLERRQHLDPETVTLLLMELARRMQDEEKKGPVQRDWVAAVLIEALVAISGQPAQSASVLSLLASFFQGAHRPGGVFVERAPGRYEFIDRDFEEYFAARWLMHSPRKAAERIHKRRHRNRWHASIQLAIGGETPANAVALAVNAILGRRAPFTPGAYEEILHRDLLLAADCLRDGAPFDADLTRYLLSALIDIVLDRGGVPEATRDRIIMVFRSLPSTTLYRGAQTRLLAALGDASLPVEVRRDLVPLLERIGRRDHETTRAFQAALQDTDAVVRADAQQALNRIDRGSREHKELGAFAKWLNSLFTRGETVASWGRTAVGDSAIVPALLRSLKGSDDTRRDEAKETLEQLGPHTPGLVRMLFQDFKDVGSPQYDPLVNVLVQLGTGNSALTHDLVGMLRSTDSKIQKAALFVLGLTGSRDPEAVQALLKFVQDAVRQGSEGSVTGPAVEALGQIGDNTPEVVSVLLQALKDENRLVRQSGAKALGQIGADTPEVVEALLERLQEEHREMREESVWALMQVGMERPEVQRVLLERLEREEWHVCLMIVQALSQIRGNASEVDEGLLGVLQHNSYEVRRAAVRALAQRVEQGDMDSRLVADCAVEMLKTQDRYLRQTGAEALGQIATATPEVLALLLAALPDAYRKVRVAAKEALEKILQRAEAQSAVPD